MSDVQSSDANCDSMVYGVFQNSPPNLDQRSTLFDVCATRHVAVEDGASELPVTLGSIDSLSYLKLKPEIYVQVLRVDCGNGTLNIIATNSNYGGTYSVFRQDCQDYRTTKCQIKTNQHFNVNDYSILH